MSLLERFMSKVSPEPMSGCWLWTAHCNWLGYGTFKMRPRGDIGAHRVAWELARGPIPAGLFVCHRCDVRSCVNPDHLFLGTAADNNRDMVAKGRHRPVVPAPPTGDTHWTRRTPERRLRGLAHPRAVFTTEKLLEVRRMAADGQTHRQIAKTLGVSQGAVSKAVKGETYK